MDFGSPCNKEHRAGEAVGADAIHESLPQLWWQGLQGKGNWWAKVSEP